MILTLKTTLIFGPYATDDWEGVFEVDSESSLEEIHALLQKTLKFDNDHMYAFYIARTERSRDRIMFDDENGGVYDRTISSLFPLPDRRNLYYLFDWGDNWLFKIARKTKTGTEPAKKVKYPRLVSESGTRPQQYPPPDEDDV